MNRVCADAGSAGYRVAATSAGDPLRPCLDHLTSWRPVRRSVAGVAALLAGAGMHADPKWRWGQLPSPHLRSSVAGDHG